MKPTKRQLEQHTLFYTVEGEVALIAGALSIALSGQQTEVQRKNLLKDARERSYKLWKRLAVRKGKR